jgi:hypothetical protein
MSRVVQMDSSMSQKSFLGLALLEFVNAAKPALFPHLFETIIMPHLLCHGGLKFGKFGFSWETPTIVRRGDFRGEHNPAEMGNR